MLPVPTLPPLRLHTPRLQLSASDPALADAVIDFQTRNARHFAPWEPLRPPDYWSRSSTAKRLAGEVTGFQAGVLWRYWISLPEAPGRIVGQCQVSQVSRGCYQSAMLGYSLDERCTGQGLMHEALSALIGEVFGERVWLHRLQASIRPENAASRRVAERLGFQHEGTSPRYLFIDGAWRDHDVFGLVNPAWAVDRAPPG